MSPPRGEETDGSSIRYPRFEHGENLLVLVGKDGYLELRTEEVGEYLRADNAVYLRDSV